jgi:signal transduction histidine kinase
LTPLMLRLELLEKQPELTPAQQKTVDVLKRNLTRLNTVVQQLLEAARLESKQLALKRQPYNLALGAAEAVERFRAAAHQSGIQLRLDAPGQHWVYVDPERLDQVFVNLLSNAIKFTPRGGYVNVHVSTQDSQVVTTVEDSGLGMTQEQLDRLFHPFQRVHSIPVEGTGLGLYISRTIVEQHGGTIIGQSRGHDRGSAFTFRLPLLEASRTA